MPGSGGSERLKARVARCFTIIHVQAAESTRRTPRKSDAAMTPDTETRTETHLRAATSMRFGSRALLAANLVLRDHCHALILRRAQIWML